MDGNAGPISLSSENTKRKAGVNSHGIFPLNTKEPIEVALSNAAATPADDEEGSSPGETSPKPLFICSLTST